jgi:hypothetical protein
MRTITRITNALVLLIVVLGFCLLLDWAANHDILNDYASKSVIDRFMPDKASLLPEWTNTSMEWMIIHLSYLAQLALAITMFVLLVIMKGKLDELKHNS